MSCLYTSSCGPGKRCHNFSSDYPLVPLTQLKIKLIFSMSTVGLIYIVTTIFPITGLTINTDICFLNPCFRCYVFISGLRCSLCFHPLYFLEVGALLVTEAPIIFLPGLGFDFLTIFQPPTTSLPFCQPAHGLQSNNFKWQF